MSVATEARQTFTEQMTRGNFFMYGIDWPPFDSIATLAAMPPTLLTRKSCENCGKPKEHGDSNLCMDCVSKMLADSEGFEG